MVSLCLICQVLLAGGLVLTTPMAAVNVLWANVFWLGCRSILRPVCVRMILWKTMKHYDLMDDMITGVSKTAAAAAGKVGSDINDGELSKAVAWKICFIDGLFQLDSDLGLRSKTLHPLRKGDPPHGRVEHPSCCKALCHLMCWNTTSDVTLYWMVGKTGQKLFDTCDDTWLSHVTTTKGANMFCFFFYLPIIK